jgi:FMN-dependent NADH-azoreductase
MNDDRSLRVLRLDASARSSASRSRAMADRFLGMLPAGAQVRHRDLAREAPPFLDEAWVEANFTAPEARDGAQRAALAGSDALVDELLATDLLLIATPMYNFGIPAVLKAWIDQIARVGRTFRYGARGPEGLVPHTRAVVLLATGGTPVEGELDLVVPYLRQVLRFVGIDDLTVLSVAALEGLDDPEPVLRAAALGTPVEVDAA